MRRFLYILILFLALSSTSDARKKPKDLIARYPALAPYFSTPSAEAMQPDEKGFIRRWLLLEPVAHETRTNTVFVDSYESNVLIPAGTRETSSFLKTARTAGMPLTAGCSMSSCTVMPSEQRQDATE